MYDVPRRARHAGRDRGDPGVPMCADTLSKPPPS
jgi:hypothetical protein